MGNLCSFWMFTNKTTIMSKQSWRILYWKKKPIDEPCGYSSDLVSWFDSKQGKHSFYRGKDCTKKFCKDLKKHVTKITNLKEKDIIPLMDEEIIYYEKQELCHIFKKELFYDKKYRKVRDHCHYKRKLQELLIAFVI